LGVVRFAINLDAQPRFHALPYHAQIDYQRRIIQSELRRFAVLDVHGLQLILLWLFAAGHIHRDVLGFHRFFVLGVFAQNVDRNVLGVLLIRQIVVNPFGMVLTAAQLDQMPAVRTMRAVVVMVVGMIMIAVIVVMVIARSGAARRIGSRLLSAPQ